MSPDNAGFSGVGRSNVENRSLNFWVGHRKTTVDKESITKMPGNFSLRSNYSHPRGKESYTKGSLARMRHHVTRPWNDDGLLNQYVFRGVKKNTSLLKQKKMCRLESPGNVRQPEFFKFNTL